MEIKDKNVSITGSTRGIGLAIARQLVSLGVSIVLNGCSEVSQDLIDNFKGYHVKAIAISGDVSNFDDARRMIDEAINELGSVGILVNNAGTTSDKLMLKMSEADSGSMFKVNLTDAFNMTQSALKPMTRVHQGTIVNLSSIAGLTGNAGQANYAVSKAGLVGFTKPIIREVTARGVRANAIAPGFIGSDMTDVIPEKMQEAISAGIPMKRIGKAREVASVASFPAQQDYLTGRVTAVDGGMTMR